MIEKDTLLAQFAALGLVGTSPSLTAGAKEVEVATANFAIMSLTEAAARRAQELLSASEKLALRVGVKNGGCAGMSYTLEFADEVGPYDEVVEDKGVKIVIDPKALMFLFGTEVDYETNKLGAGFVFNNPNQTGSCGCGESVSITPAEQVGTSSATLPPEAL
jgi:iron-sulfur cluster assembly protein